MSDTDISDYEQARLQNIRKNKELLGNFVPLKASTIAPAPVVTPAKRKPPPPKRSRSSSPTSPAVRRRSARLANLPPEGQKVLEKEVQKYQAAVAAEEKAKRGRREGNLTLEDTLDNSELLESAGRFFKEISNLTSDGRVPTYERVVVNQQLADTDDERILEMRALFSDMGIYTEEAHYKTNPMRIYTAAFHPSANKALSCTGDKSGTLSFWDLSDYLLQGSTVDLDEKVYTLKPHSEGLTELCYHPTNHTRLYSSSYDCSIRMLDLTQQVFSEVWVGPSRKHFVQSLDMDKQQGNTLWFALSTGELGRMDLRMASTSSGTQRVRRRAAAAAIKTEDNEATFTTCHDKKVGCVSVHPDLSHYVLTASGDQTAKLWDVRHMSTQRLNGTDDDGDAAVDTYDCPFTHRHRYSCTSALWAPSATSTSTSSLRNAFVTTSYDDLLHIWRQVDLSPTDSTTLSISNPASHNGHNDALAVHHDNHTGRWVTNFRARFHPNPALPVVLVGNMRRAIDIISADTGELVWQLKDEERLTAIPAVVAVHPAIDNLIVSANGSGRCAVWYKQATSASA